MCWMEYLFNWREEKRLDVLVVQVQANPQSSKLFLEWQNVRVIQKYCLMEKIFISLGYILSDKRFLLYHKSHSYLQEQFVEMLTLLNNMQMKRYGKPSDWLNSINMLEKQKGVLKLTWVNISFNTFIK